MKRRSKRRSADDTNTAGTTGRSSPVRRRVLMMAIVVVTGLLVYFASERPKESGQATLQGTVYLDDQPFSAARLIFEREDRSDNLDGGSNKKHVAGISHSWTYSKTDADGRYKVDFQSGGIYTVAVRRPGQEKEKPFKQADGTLPSVDVGAGTKRFDIRLVSGK